MRGTQPRQSDIRTRVELTFHAKGPVIRAEAAAQDAYSALDLAVARLETRLRRSADRRRIHHGHRTPMSVAAATAPERTLDAPFDEVADQSPNGHPGEEREITAGGAGSEGSEGSLVVREKTHRAESMTLDQALFEMELVGHDFFLFVDKDSGLPSVVYRRRVTPTAVIRPSPPRRATARAGRRVRPTSPSGAVPMA